MLATHSVLVRRLTNFLRVRDGRDVLVDDAVVHELDDLAVEVARGHAHIPLARIVDVEVVLDVGIGWNDFLDAHVLVPLLADGSVEHL